MTSTLLDRRTRAIFRIAEFGLRGDITRTCMQTPLFCGAPRRSDRDRLVNALWIVLSAGDLDLDRFRGRRRGFLTSWLSVGKLSYLRCMRRRILRTAWHGEPRRNARQTIHYTIKSADNDNPRCLTERRTI